jgi:hypothetical protein
MSIPAYALRAIQQIARLGPRELTAVGPVVLGTEACREILQALEDAETLRAVRALVAGGKVSTETLRALLSSSGTETVELKGKVDATDTATPLPRS